MHLIHPDQRFFTDLQLFWLVCKNEEFQTQLSSACIIIGCLNKAEFLWPQRASIEIQPGSYSPLICSNSNFVFTFKNSIVLSFTTNLQSICIWLVYDMNLRSSILFCFCFLHMSNFPCFMYLKDHPLLIERHCHRFYKSGDYIFLYVFTVM